MEEAREEEIHCRYINVKTCHKQEPCILYLVNWNILVSSERSLKQVQD